MIAAGISGALGVALGAFGAHALRLWLPLQQTTIYETAVRYHLLHALALFATALWMELAPARAAALRPVARLFLAGIVLFSGSLYGLSVAGLEWLGAVTPLGGAAWIAAWGWLAWAAWRGGGR